MNAKKHSSIVNVFTSLRARIALRFARADWASAIDEIQAELGRTLPGEDPEARDAAQLLVAIIHQKRGALEYAERIVNRLECNPASEWIMANTLLYKSKIASQSGRFQEADDVLNRLQRDSQTLDMLGEGGRQTLLWRHGLAKLVLGDWDSAAELFKMHRESIDPGGFREANNIVFHEVAATILACDPAEVLKGKVGRRLRYAMSLYAGSSTDIKDRLAHRGKCLVHSLLLEAALRIVCKDTYSSVLQVLLATHLLKRWNLYPVCEGVGEAAAILKLVASEYYDLYINSANQEATEFLEGLKGSDFFDTVRTSIGLVATIAEEFVSSQNWDAVNRYWSILPGLEDYTGISSTSISTHERSILKESAKVTGILHISDLQAGQGILSSEVRAEQVAETLVADIIADVERTNIVAPSVVVISGDIANASLPGEYRIAQVFLMNLKASLQHAGCPIDEGRFILVPGNHDVSWDVADTVSGIDSKCEWAKMVFFGDFTNSFYRGAQVWVGSISWSIFDFSQSSEVAFLALNSTTPEYRDMHWGGIDPAVLDDGCAALGAHPGAKVRVAVWHHNVVPIEEVRGGRREARPDYLRNASEVLDKLYDVGVRVVLHGHMHVNELVTAKAVRGRAEGIWCVGAPALGAVAKDRPGVEGDTVAPRGYLVLTLRSWPGAQTTLSVRRKDVTIGADGKLHFVLGTIEDNVEKTITLE